LLHFINFYIILLLLNHFQYKTVISFFLSLLKATSNLCSSTSQERIPSSLTEFSVLDIWIIWHIWNIWPICTTPKSESELSDTNSTWILLLNRITCSFLSSFYIGVYFYFLGYIIWRKVLISDPSEVLDGINFFSSF